MTNFRELMPMVISTVRYKKQLISFKDCCFMLAYARVDVKCVTLTRARKKLMNCLDGTTQDEMEDNITTDVEDAYNTENITAIMAFLNTLKYLRR